MNGWIFIDKPKNITSFKVIKILRKILKIKKIGHSGTLDPFATGILAIAIGEATKSIQYFVTNKTYQFNVIFGELKDTDDITGITLKRSDVIPTKKQIDEGVINFIGQHYQNPPKYSAIKIKGQRAYKLARRNKIFDIPKKKVIIERLQCIEKLSANEFSFLLECSAGTYVRSIARDLGEMLGTFAHVSELRRTKMGKIQEKDIILLDKFRELVHIGDHFGVVHSIRDVLDDIPAVMIDSELSYKFQNGLGFKYPINKYKSDYLLIETKTGFLGIGKSMNGIIKPVRVFNL